MPVQIGENNYTYSFLSESNHLFALHAEVTTQWPLARPFSDTECQLGSGQKGPQYREAGETINTTIAAVQPPASTEAHSAIGGRVLHSIFRAPSTLITID